MLADVTKRTFLEILREEQIPYDDRPSDNKVTLTEPGSEVVFRSLENPDSLRGPNLAWFGCDELSYASKDAWRVLEGRLREPKAVLLCGFGGWTPKGFNWVYDKFVSPEKPAGYEAVIASPAENRAILDKDPDFYERLKGSYDERFYRQEVLGEYLSLTSGTAYYAFERTGNCAEVGFDRRAPLCWSMDFNVNPMCSVLSQVVDGRVLVLDEIVLPDSNTHEACEEFLVRAEQYRVILRGDQFGSVKLTVHVYGDASGSSRSTAGRSDWQIVREFFGRHSDKFQAVFRVTSSNPMVRDRVNAVNAMLRNYAGKRRLLVGTRCKELVRDLERVLWRQDTSGNVLSQLDKSDPARTHISDGLGYMIDREFGLRVKGGPRTESLGV